jgi:hypothetical protein
MRAKGSADAAIVVQGIAVSPGATHEPTVPAGLARYGVHL